MRHHRPPRLDAPGDGQQKTLLVVGALLVLVSGGVHLQSWIANYWALPVIGPLFLLNTCSAAVLAVALLAAALARPRALEPLALLFGWGFAALTLAAFLISATRGLFGFSESLVGTEQAVAGIAEALTLIVTGWALQRWLRREIRTRHARL